ncbi:SDR family NAD(P)-dependent oxidoreductase [Rhizosphaericola mali]|uniref:SDR family NAD(P)-dependent oxidoreductase n=1 Tax=Rhizosphaericola mali TaxID=2545455 RepID=A0A5P2FZD6_9BACT|nr:SDR family NAD(P)-dependent oxidoreductase [Rhizosphaericola mali]QES87189.1 SDR family NAD(P)-dependent oxidoreductase [Rhizosphaericola mali]
MHRIHKTGIITGGSKGLGYSLAKVALEHGDDVIITTRNKAKFPAELADHPQVHIYELDLTSSHAIEDFAKAILSKFPHIDYLVNNAGYGFIGAIEESSDVEIQQILNINLLAGIRMIQAFLPQLRKQKQGHIINISSMAGLKGSAGWGVYNLSKFAVEGYTEALYEEMQPLGIQVSLVEPGAFRTNFLDTSLQSSKKIMPEYQDTVGQRRIRLQNNNGHQPNAPEKAAISIYSLLQANAAPLRLLLGKDALSLATNKINSLQHDFELTKKDTLNTNI